jgi:hypothetical protein
MKAYFRRHWVLARIDANELPKFGPIGRRMKAPVWSSHCFIQHAIAKKQFERPILQSQKRFSTKKINDFQAQSPTPWSLIYFFSED